MGGCYGMCHRCCGIKKVVIGALLLLNVFVWPKLGLEGGLWMNLSDLSFSEVVAGWVTFLAALYVLSGLVKLFVPNKCGHCAAMCGSEMKSKKK